DALLHRDTCAAVSVVAVGASAAEELQASGYRPDGVLGYSLGLYTAAAVSGAITVETALRLVAMIAREGEASFPPGEMAMAFVTRMKVVTLDEALRDSLDAGSLALTNVNTQ